MLRDEVLAPDAVELAAGGGRPLLRALPPAEEAHDLDEHGLGERARLDALLDLLDAGGGLDQLERADHAANLLADPGPQMAVGSDARGRHAVALDLVTGLTV